MSGLRILYFLCSARVMHKLHGMGSQPQAFAKPVCGCGWDGTPASACPPSTGGPRPSVPSSQLGKAGPGAASMSVQEQLHPGLPRCSWHKPPKTAAWQQPGPAPHMQPYPRQAQGQVWAQGKQRRGAPQESGKLPHYIHQSVMISYKFFQGSLRGD